MTDQQPDPLEQEIGRHLQQRADEIVLPEPDPVRPRELSRQANRRRIGAGVGALTVTALAMGGLAMINNGGDGPGEEVAVEAADEDTTASADAASSVPTAGLSFGAGSAATALGLEGEAYISSIEATDDGWLAVVQRWDESAGPRGPQMEILRSTDGENWEPGPGPALGPDESIDRLIVEGDVMVATGSAFPEGFFDRLEEFEGEEAYYEPYGESPTPQVWVSLDRGSSWTSSELAGDRPDLPEWAHSNTWLSGVAVEGSTILVSGSTYVDFDIAALLGEDDRVRDHGYGWGIGPGGEFQVEVWRGETEEPEIFTAEELGIDPSVVEQLGQEDSTVWRSTDGTTWEPLDGPADTMLEQIMVGPGGFYSIGYPRYDEFDRPAEEPGEFGPNLWRSADGSNWEAVEGLPVDGETYVQQLFSFGDDIAVVTEEWPNGPQLWRFDGVSWHREALDGLVTLGTEERIWFEQVAAGPAGTLIMASVQKEYYGPEPLVDEIVIEKDGLVLRQPVGGPRETEPPEFVAIIETADGAVVAEYRWDDQEYTEEEYSDGTVEEGPATGIRWEEDGNTYYTIYSDPETGEELMRLTDREMEEAWSQAYPDELYEDDEYVEPRRYLLWRSAGATEWQSLDQAEVLGFQGWTQAVAVGSDQVMIVIQEEPEYGVEMPPIYEEFEMAMQDLHDQLGNGDLTDEEFEVAMEALQNEFEPQMAAAEETIPRPEMRIFVGRLD